MLIECRYAELVYNGFWFSPEREMLQASIDASQKYVSGTVRLKLYKVLTTPLNTFVGTQYLGNPSGIPRDHLQKVYLFSVIVSRNAFSLIQPRDTVYKTISLIQQERKRYRDYRMQTS